MRQTNFNDVDVKSLSVQGIAMTSSQAVAANVPALTENGGAIGGTNDGNLPDLSPTYVARTAAVGGTADGAYQDELTLSTAGGNTYTDTAVNTVIGKLKNNIAELATVVAQLAADNANLRAAVRENAAKLNAEIAALKTATIQASV